jgi:hypothetical protein
MFGWLASFGVHSRARSTAATTRWLALVPRSLFEGLGQLGGVLYLAPRLASCPGQTEPARGCLVESADLAPLLATRYVGLTCAITAEGPREWIDCVNGEGGTVARIYLLPDTDYLAWDGLFADALPIIEPERGTPDREWMRASRARILSFTRRRLAGFTVLGTCEVPVSSLGRGVARDIAVSESVGI